MFRLGLWISLWAAVASIKITEAAEVTVRHEMQNKIEAPTFADPDAYGYRYCAFWKMVNGVRLWTDCDPYVHQRCGKPIEFEYRCCTQFKQVRETVFPLNPSGKEKCAQVVPQWDFCPTLLENTVGQRSFASHLKFGDFIQEKPSTTFTIFAPHSRNQIAINDMFGKFKDRKNTNPILQHVVKGRVYARDLRDGMVLETMLGTKLKVSKYSNGVTSVDCVELIQADLECKNGLVHFIRKPLLAPKGLAVERGNVYEALSSDPRTKAFANDIPAALAEELRQVNSGIWFTVLAPLESEWLKIRTTYPDAATRALIVQNHIFRKMLCSSALISHMTGMKSSLGESVSVQCTTEMVNNRTEEVRYVSSTCGEKRQFVESDLAAVNGVIHVISGPVVPMAARKIENVLECGEALNFKRFADYIKECDLRMEAGKKYAMLLPMDYAFDWWANYQQFKPEYERFMTDEEYRCRVARYHITAFNDQLDRIATLWHEQKGYVSNTIDPRYQVDYFQKDRHKSQLNFHYSPIVNFEAMKFADGTLYRIQRINVIPEKFMVDVLKEREDVQAAYEKVIQTDMDGRVFKPNQPLNLFLATKNEGWKEAGSAVWKKEYTWPNQTLTNLLMLHSIPLYLWGGDIGYFKPNTVHRFTSRLGVELIFWMDEKGVMRIGHDEMPDKNQWPRVVEWNLHAIDGIIWLLDGLLTCPKKYCAIEMIEFEVYEVFTVACMYREFGDDKTDRTTEFKKKPYEVALTQPQICVWYKQAPVRVRQLGQDRK